MMASRAAIATKGLGAFLIAAVCSISCSLQRPQIVWKNLEPTASSTLIVHIWNFKDKPSTAFPMLVSGVAEPQTNEKGIQPEIISTGSLRYSNLTAGDFTLLVSYHCVMDDLSTPFKKVVQTFHIASGESKEVDVTLNCQGGLYIN